MEQKQQSNLRSLLLLGKLPKAAPTGLSSSSAEKAQAAPLTSPASSQSHLSANSAVHSTPQSAPTQPAQATTASLLNLYNSGITAQFSSLIPALMTLKGQMIQELEEHLTRLLSLNPSRREAIAQYLDRLASQTAAPSSTSGIGDAGGGLRRWVEGPRTPAQNAALRSYFEEAALIFLGQAILLKAWADASLRRFTEADIGKLNWALSTALKPHVPMDREGWQFTRPNLYSWYTPSQTIQHQIWLTLEQTRMSEESPALILSIAGPARQAQPEAKIPQGYDNRFFKAIWNGLANLGADLSMDSGPIRRQRIAFSPTLRDGSMVRTGPTSLTWVGMESSPFQLMIAELMQLWWGPQAPPLWSTGAGLEAHTRDQLSLALSSPKPSLLSRIADMEACDIAFTLEEKTIRSQSRNSEGQRFREQLEALPYFKKLRAAGTSLGDLQACVALNKLRPGGLLWWAREEPLTQEDGAEVLSFLLDRAKLVCEWDLSGLEHSLPVSLPLFPKYLYLLSRESNVEERLSHRPKRVTLHGAIRSHIEVPVVLEDALNGLQGNLTPRGQWQIHALTSPTSQKDWAERWPDPASQNMIRVLEELRNSSVPLANVSTVRNASANGFTEVTGIWIQAETGRTLQVQQTGQQPLKQKDDKTPAFLILVPDTSWIAPLTAYLASNTVRDWLDHHAERKGDRWVLTEQVVRWIPVPKLLLAELGVDHTTRPKMSEEWQRILSEVATKPAQALDAIRKLPKDQSTLALRSAIFVQASQGLDRLKSGKKNLLSIVDEEGRLAWAKLFDILPKSEFVQITLHSRVAVTGNLPLHLPISRIEKVKSPTQGVLLATEVGMYTHLGSDDSIVVDMLWEQLQNVKHPTWSELVQSLRLPRKIESARATAEEVLKSHAEVSSKILALSELLSDCSVY